MCACVRGWVVNSWIGVFWGSSFGSGFGGGGDHRFIHITDRGLLVDKRVYPLYLYTCYYYLAVLKTNIFVRIDFDFEMMNA